MPVLPPPPPPPIWAKNVESPPANPSAPVEPTPPVPPAPTTKGTLAPTLAAVYMRSEYPAPPPPAPHDLAVGEVLPPPPPPPPPTIRTLHQIIAAGMVQVPAPAALNI